MTEASTQHGDGLLASKASASSAAYQHQKLTHTERGDSWGMCAPIPAVVYDDMQDRPSNAVPARAGFLSMIAYLLPVELAGLCGPVLFPNSHRLAVPTWSLLPCNGAARHLVPRCAGSRRARDLSAIGSGSRPAVGNASAHHQSVNAFGDVPHVQVLSSPLFSSGIDPNEIGLTEWETKSCSRSKRK